MKEKDEQSGLTFEKQTQIWSDIWTLKMIISSIKWPCDRRSIIQQNITSSDEFGECRVRHRMSGEYLLFIQRRPGAFLLSPHRGLFPSLPTRSIDPGRKRGPSTLTFDGKNIISVEKSLFHERYLLVIKGLKRLSKVSEITLVTKLGTRQLTFSAKLQQRIRRDAFFTKWRSNRLLALLVSKFQLRHFPVCKGA